MADSIGNHTAAATNLSEANTDTATVEGVQAAYDLIRAEFPEVDAMAAQLEVNSAASDWRAGREDLVMRRLTERYGLTMAYRLVAVMLATPGTPPGA